jgi:UMF1 family MFS transporter
MKSSAPVTRREIFGWCCFDFANSSFTTVIITVVFSVYFAKVICGGDPAADRWWSGALSFSQGLVILLAPWLGAVADLRAAKKTFLAVSAVACCFFTLLLGTTGPGTWTWAVSLLVMANAAFALGENFCASFLPEISTPENCGKISGYGWAFGYCGGLLSLVFCLGLFQGLGESVMTTRLTFVMTACFFATGAIPTLFLLRERAVPRGVVTWRSSLWAGWAEVARTLRGLPGQPQLAGFLFAFVLFMSGLSAIIAFAGIFASRELNFTITETIFLFASLQVSSALGAFGFGYFQDRFGTRKTLIVSLLLWMVVGVAAYFCNDKTAFFAIGNLAGLVIGSTQSASRAQVALLAPEGKSGEIFGFWGLSARLAAIVGVSVVGNLSAHFGLRFAVLANTAFFVAGLLVFVMLGGGHAGQKQQTAGTGDLPQA